MKLYIKQKVFSFADKFFVYDEGGNEIYTVKGEFFSLGKKFHIYDYNNNEVLFIHQKLLTFLPKYFISENGRDEVMFKSYMTFLKPHYSVDAYGWDINGDFFEHNYQISKGTDFVASVSKRWFTWGDTYEIEITNDGDALGVLACVLIIDAIEAAKNSSSDSSD